MQTQASPVHFQPIHRGRFGVFVFGVLVRAIPPPSPPSGEDVEDPASLGKKVSTDPSRLRNKVGLAEPR